MPSGREGARRFLPPRRCFFPEYLNDLTRAISLGAGWVINVAIAEWVIRRRLQAKKVVEG
jgi:hypothetical protein